MRHTLTSLFILLLLAAGARARVEGATPRQDRQPPQTAAASRPDLDEAERLSAQAAGLFGQGKFDEALPLARRALELREGRLGGEHLLVAHSLGNLAVIYIQKDKHGDAEPLLRRALAIGEKAGERERAFVAELHAQLAVVRFKDRDYKETEAHLQSALALYEKVGGGQRGVLSALLNLADLYYVRREAEKGDASLERAVSVVNGQPPRKDEATARRLTAYLCVLLGGRRNVELSNKVSKAIYRLEEPEKAAAWEKKEKERAARGEADNPSAEGGVLNGHAVSKPPPMYPDEAKRRRVMGAVVIKIVVDETGKVTEAKALCGHPLLAGAGEQAARAARFTPTLLAGQPVKVSGVITYNFVLQ